ncbi:MAG: LuxR C-terminal-related transcriptional regulator [Acidimicrobiales bacterium]
MPEIVSVRNRARFVPPRIEGPVVSRDRLDGCYAEATGRVLRVLAPPGYGKSTQVALWVAADPRRVGWVDLERIDNDPLVLAAALSRALLGSDAAEEELAHGPLDGGGPVDQVRAAIAALTERVDAPFVLVLDDMHNLGPETADVVDAVAAHLPSHSTLVLCGRSHADGGSLARRRLQPGVVDVTVANLALDAPETEELLQMMDVHLELEALAQLCDRFEGWVAGLRLAGLALRSSGDQPWLDPDHVGDATFVVDYLRSEWTGQLSADDRRFLGEAACLQRFTGAMCDEILGREGSHERLRRMHREELLLLPLDQRDQWFRMHPLLTRWLSLDLQETDPVRWQAIHVAAAAWWRGRGDVDLAFEHVMAIHDLGAAEALVAEHGVTYLSRGLSSTARRWLSAFPSELVQRSAGLCAVNAIDALHRGDGGQSLRWYEHLDRVLGPRRSTSGDIDSQRADILRITLAREAATTLLPVADALSVGLEGDVWTAIALYATGGLRFLAGDDRAADALEAAAFVAELNDLWVHQANCTSARGILADLSGDHEAAASASRRANDLLARWPTDLPPTTAMTDALTAVVAARAGRREVAARLLEQGQRKRDVINSVSPWFNTICGLALARAAVLIDDRARSRTLLRELEDCLRLEAQDHGAAAHVADLHHQIDAARQLSGDPSWALTEAELNVLQHLPTNLTLADIATRLFVSRNTVKSHVAAIYRKLDATSRGDAVERARRTGLLEASAGENRD